MVSSFWPKYQRNLFKNFCPSLQKEFNSHKSSSKWFLNFWFSSFLEARAFRNLLTFRNPTNHEMNETWLYFLYFFFSSFCRDNESSNILDNLLSRMELYANNLEALVKERTSDYFFSYVKEVLKYLANYQYSISILDALDMWLLPVRFKYKPGYRPCDLL